MLVKICMLLLLLLLLSLLLLFAQNQVNHGGNISGYTCDQVNPEYDGPVGVTCIRGEFVGDFSRCNAACYPSYQVPVSMGPFNFTVSPKVRMTHGSNTSGLLCSDSVAAATGNFTVSCSQGVPQVNKTACNLSCSPLYVSGTLYADKKSWNVTPAALMLAGR